MTRSPLGPLLLPALLVGTIALAARTAHDILISQPEFWPSAAAVQLIALLFAAGSLFLLLRATASSVREPITSLADRYQAAAGEPAVKEPDGRLLQNLAEGVLMLDRRGRFTYVNAAAARLLGYTVAQLMGKQWINVTPPDQRAVVLELERSRTQGIADRREVVLLRGNGSRLTALVNCTARAAGVESAGMLAVVTDITDWKLAQQRLARSLAEQAAAADEKGRLLGAYQQQVGNLAQLYDTAPAAANSHGVQQLLAELGQRVQRMCPADSFAAALYHPPSGQIEIALATRNGAGDDELAGLRFAADDDNLISWVIRTRRVLLIGDLLSDSLPAAPRYLQPSARSWLGVPLIAGQDRLQGIVAVASAAPGAFGDAERMLLELLAGQAAVTLDIARVLASLEANNVHLRQLSSAKDQMIQNVSHELRAPLTLLRGYVDLLTEGSLGGPLQPEHLEAIRVMEQQVSRLRQMVERLLTLKAMEPGRLQLMALDLGEWLRQAVAGWDVRCAEAQLQLRLDSPRHLPPVMADPDYLGQVMNNLLDNAVKYSPAGGSLRILACAEGSEVVVAVSDGGIGVPGDKLELIFERFYQIDGGRDRRQGGMGIGLALCKQIVELHQGRIWAESEGEGKGTTVSLALPIAPCPA